MERLTIPLAEINFETKADGADLSTFKGYGAVFNNVDLGGDTIAPGAFTATIAKARKSGLWPAMLSQHGGMGLTAQDLTPVGLWLDMDEDSRGLKLDGALAPTPRGQELGALMKMQPRPAINGLSIGYIPRDYEIHEPSKTGPYRTLKAVDLIEISLVTFPMNPKARVTGVKAIGDTERDVERWLMQDAGLTRREARVVLNQGFKALLAGMRDAADESSDELQALLASARSRGAAFSI